MIFFIYLHGERADFMRRKTENPDFQHPLEEHARLIEERGLVVFDDVTSMPNNGEPYVSPFFVIGLNHSGYVKCQYDMMPVEFHPHDIAMIYPDHIVMAKESSPDYRVTLVAFSRRILQEIGHRSAHRYQLEYMKKPDFHLSDEQYETMLSALNILRSACKMEVSNRESILVGLLDLLSQMIDAYRFPNNELPAEQSQGKQLFYRFYDAIVKHHRESHEICYYAQLLCYSPKYFSSMIKEETGVSASTWIARYLIVQAKSLLRGGALNNQQISDLLGFPEQSSFSRFFKIQTGMSPSQFRKLKE